MKGISVTDLLDNTTYEQRRGEFRSRIIGIKKDRGINLGPILRLVFENRDTLLFQIQEMLFVERTSDPEKRAEEVEIYRTMLPSRSTLSATLMIEITEESRIRDTLDTLQGLDRGPYLHLVFAGERVTASFEPDRSTDEKLSSVHYLTFGFTEKQRSMFLGLSEGEKVMLLSDHPRYSAMAVLSPATIRSLRDDLSDD
ncbi:MAG: DUF3501 family protein [Nitrospirae bacterium]|jgi:hypothetical protein|nr:DUF3501 family protein [Nitrospirota bacterium]